METIKNKFILTMKKFAKILSKPEMRVLPGQLAFYFLMSLIPIIAIVAFISSRLITNYNLLSLLNNNVPQVLVDVVSSAVTSASNYGNVGMLLVFYFVLASNGPFSIIRASNTLYGIKEPKYLLSRIKAIIMTLLLVLLLLFIIIIPIFGDTIINFVLSIFNARNIIKEYAVLYGVVKLLLSFVFIYFSVKFIYMLAPYKKIDHRLFRIGTFFTSITWIIANLVFSIYVTSIANYSALYGNFANILVLLLWMYILAYLFVIGMALNANAYNEYKINIFDKY